MQTLLKSTVCALTIMLSGCACQKLPVEDQVRPARIQLPEPGSFQLRYQTARKKLSTGLTAPTPTKPTEPTE